jgi:hypothetical protein
VQAVFGCDGRGGATAYGLDKALPLAHEAAAGDIALDRVFDRLPCLAAAERHAVEEIDIDHAAIEGQFVARDEGAVSITDAGDLADGIVAEAQQQKGYVVGLLLVEAGG